MRADDIPVFEAPTDRGADADPGDDDPCVVTVSTSGNLGRVVAAGGKTGVVGRHDRVSAAAVTSTAAEVAAVTSEGRAFVLRAGDVADAGGRTRGNAAAQQLGLNKGEVVRALVGTGGENLVLVTVDGIAKRLTTAEVLGTKAGRPVIGLRDDDLVVAAFRATAGVDMIIVASDGQTLRLPVDSVSVQGRGATGVVGMKLKTGAVVVGAGPVIGDGVVVAVTSDSAVKATSFDEFEAKGRGGQGVRNAKLATGEAVTLAWVGSLEPAGVLLAQMAADDDPKKLDPNPVPLEVDPSRRDLVPLRTERQIMVLGRARW